MHLTMSARQIGQNRNLVRSQPHPASEGAEKLHTLCSKRYAAKQPNLVLWKKGATEAAEKAVRPLLSCTEAL